MIYYLKQSLVILVLSHLVNLVDEWNRRLEFLGDEFVVMAHNNYLLFSFHGLFSEVAGFIIKKTVRITSPGDTFH